MRGTLLAVALFGFVLACGGGKEPAEEPAPPTPAVEAEKGEPVIILTDKTVDATIRLFEYLRAEGKAMEEAATVFDKMARGEKASVKIQEIADSGGIDKEEIGLYMQKTMRACSYLKARAGMEKSKKEMQKSAAKSSGAGAAMAEAAMKMMEQTMVQLRQGISDEELKVVEEYSPRFDKLSSK